MLVQGISSQEWEDSFSKKFSSLCKKSPVLLKYSNRTQDGERGVLVTHVNTGLRYFYPFDYDMNVKDFIALVKKDISNKHYPRLVEDVLQAYEKTNEELAIELENGADAKSIKKYSMKSVGVRQYKIDKILSWKQIAILELEKSSFPEDNLHTLYRYQYDGSLVIFLKNYRNGKFKNIEDASAVFFSNANLVDELPKKTEA